MIINIKFSLIRQMARSFICHVLFHVFFMIWSCDFEDSLMYLNSPFEWDSNQQTSCDQPFSVIFGCSSWLSGRKNHFPRLHFYTCSYSVWSSTCSKTGSVQKCARKWRICFGFFIHFQILGEDLSSFFKKNQSNKLQWNLSREFFLDLSGFRDLHFKS